MNPKLLRRVGELLYGPYWCAPLAAALEVDERTLRRWSNETHPIPGMVVSDLIRDLIRLVDQHGQNMLALVLALTRAEQDILIGMRDGG